LHISNTTLNSDYILLIFSLNITTVYITVYINDVPEFRSVATLSLPGTLSRFLKKEAVARYQGSARKYKKDGCLEITHRI
jgi:hypothetical protein